MHRRLVAAAAAWAAIAFGVLAWPAAAQEADLANAPRITQAEFRKLWAEHNVLVVDVRDLASYRSGHIPGAVWIPLDQVVARATDLKAETKPIVTYCA